MKLFKATPFIELKTDRLLLRCPKITDATDYHRILSCPEIACHSDMPRNPTAQRSKQFVNWMAKLHARGTGVAWIAEMQSSGNVVGSFRINSIEKKARCGVIGYELHPKVWGSGIATEALAAVVSHAHNTLNLNRLEAWITEGNTASEHVLIKNGFQFEGTQRDKVWFNEQFWNIGLYARLAEDDKHPTNG